MRTYAIVAEETPAPGTGEGGKPENPYGMMLLLGGCIVVFYLVVIWPQRKREKERQRKREEMLGALSKNDHVMTIGGIHGVVVSVSDDAVVLRVDEKNDTRMRMTRDAISRVVGLEDEGETAAAPGG